MLWTQRLAKPADKLFVELAEDGETLVGFACAILDEHPRYGALLDNLHVLQPMQGRGIGRRLLASAAGWCEAHRRHAGLHLWVYERNQEARRFYERFGARELQRVVTDVPGGGDTTCLRYGWASASDAARFSVAGSA